jgi:hypothetical protein
VTIDLDTFFTPAPPPPPERPHWLVVEEDELDIEHHDDCPRVDGDGWWDYACGIGWEVSYLGITEFFLHPEDVADYGPTTWCDRPKLIAGRYLIEHWSERTYHYEYGYEYSSGVQLVYPEEAQP